MREHRDGQTDNNFRTVWLSVPLWPVATTQMMRSILWSSLTQSPSTLRPCSQGISQEDSPLWSQFIKCLDTFEDQYLSCSLLDLLIINLKVYFTVFFLHGLHRWWGDPSAWQASWWFTCRTLRDETELCRNLKHSVQWYATLRNIWSIHPKDLIKCNHHPTLCIWNSVVIWLFK